LDDGLKALGDGCQGKLASGTLRLTLCCCWAEDPPWPVGLWPSAPPRAGSGIGSTRVHQRAASGLPSDGTLDKTWLGPGAGSSAGHGNGQGGASGPPSLLAGGPREEGGPPWSTP